jgi:hypothetical protein
MPRTGATSVALGLAVLGLIAATRSAPADDGCSNATLRGRYGIEASGTIASGPLAGPTALVGVVTYDGFGQVSGTITQRVTTATGPTTLANIPLAGTYLVNADCTAEDTVFNLANGTSSVHAYSIVEKGRRFSILNTTTGPTVVLGAGIRQTGGVPRD